MTDLSGYELSRIWFDFAFENPEKVRPLHAAIFFFAIEHCNRLGWKKKFGFPTQMAMEAIGVKKYDTYINGLRDLIEWGFIDMIEQSKNQYSSNVISLGSGTPKNGKALDKALICHTKKRQSTGQSTGQSMGESIVSINKQVTKNKEQGKIPPPLSDVKAYCEERKNNVDYNRWYNFYQAKNWMIGKNKMKDWKAAVRTWETEATKKPPQPYVDEATGRVVYPEGFKVSQ
jgi:hypothetical protein